MLELSKLTLIPLSAEAIGKDTNFGWIPPNHLRIVIPPNFSLCSAEKESPPIFPWIWGNSSTFCHPCFLGVKELPSFFENAYLIKTIIMACNSIWNIWNISKNIFIHDFIYIFFFREKDFKKSIKSLKDCSIFKYYFWKTK